MYKGIALGVLFVFVTCVSLHVNAQKSQERQLALEKSLPASQMQNGVYYYPEHWPKNRWDRDLGRIASLGFTFTHFAEFAWDRLEPSEGQYNFGWLDTAIALAAKHKLKVILCTPSATPPAWMTHKYPDILMAKQDGQSIEHGARQHSSWASERYRSYCAKLVEAMARRYGKNKTIWGWQLDNEPSHYNRYDYSETNQQGFRKWLQTRYKSLGGLNSAWGTAFWSVTYSDWSQVRIPNPSVLVQQANPHAMLDFSRYTAHSIAQFLDIQADVIRQYADASQWITTNYMGMAGHQHADPILTKSLDFVSLTSYPASGGLGLSTSGPEHFRLGDPYLFSFNLEHMRDAKGAVGMMELQPGQTNWGSFNTQPMPESISLWLWHTYALGSRFVCNYRFDQPVYGGELHYSAMTYPDGYTLRPTGQAWVNTMKVIDSVSKLNKPTNNPFPVNGVGLLVDMESIWDLQINKLTEQWVSVNHIQKYYTAVKRLGLGTTIVKPADCNNFRHKVMIVPALSLTRPHLTDALVKYAEQGGHLLITARSLVKDTNGHLLASAYSEPLARLTGYKVVFNDMLPKTSVGQVTLDGKSYGWNNWAEVLAPINEAAKRQSEVWGLHASMFYNNSPVVVHRRLGKGSVTYVGLDTDEGQLEQAILTKLTNLAGLQPLDLPEGVVVERRGNQMIFLNYSNSTFVPTLPKNAKLIYGKRQLNLGDVAVWVL